MTEFDNVTEFAGYIAKKFETAEALRKDDNYIHSGCTIWMNSCMQQTVK